MYDTAAQYGQVLSGEVDDWHPPAMVRLWQLLHPLGGGARPMFVLQVALYGAGFGLMSAALVKGGRPRSAFAVGVLALSPLLLGWQMVVLKDGLMLGAMLVAAGLIALFTFDERRVPLWTAAIVAVMLALATLVRANALFATVPLAVLLWGRPRGIHARLGLGVLAILLLLGTEPIINRHVFDAQPSGVAKTQPLFDMAAIAVAHPEDPAPFTRAERDFIARRHCVKPFFWDPLGDEGACELATRRFADLPAGQLYKALFRAAAAHPVSYLWHRLRHWNSTERWLVRPGLPDAAPPDEGEPNDVGLVSPSGPLVDAWQRAAAVEAATPLGWPICWTAIALVLVPLAWRRRSEAAGGLAFALLVSAIGLEASFLVVSIASDLRYHLWPMAATGLALVLLLPHVRVTRTAVVGGIALAVVIGGGLLARATLPRAPDSYQGMIAEPSG